MDKLDRFAGRHRPDGDVALWYVLGCLHDWQARLIRESGVVGLGVDRDGGTGWLYVLLVQIFLQGFEDIHQRVEGVVPVGVAFHINNRSLRQRYLLAKSIPWL